MKKLLSLLFLLLPVASFAEDTADDMTTIFEEHFDGWLYPHESGMNATYKYKTSDISMQTYEAYNIPPNKLPCLRFAKLSSCATKIIISNFTGAYGKFILSYYKSYKASFSVSYATDKDEKKEIKSSNPDGTFTFNVQPNRSQIILSFNNDGSNVAVLDDIIVKAPTSSITTSTSPDAKLSFNQQEMSAAIGTTYNSSQLLSNPNSLPIKWYSSNQATATVDTSGNVTPHFIGTTTIYAIFEGNNDYAYQAVSYQLTTRREPLNNEVYYDGFADYDGPDGNGGNLVDNEYEGNYKYTPGYYISNTSPFLYKGYQCLEIDTSYTIKNLEKYGLKNGRLNFKYALSEYSSKTPVTVTLKYSDNSTHKALDDVLDKMKWTDISVPISSDCQLSSVTFSGKKFFIDEISIISEDFITIGSTGYATLYYSGRAIKIPTGLTAYTMKVENGKIVKSRAYSEGETLPKATAVILRGKPGKYKLDTSTKEGTTDNNNQLKGSDTKANTTGNDDDYFYMLANKDGEGVGFYWGAKNGAAFLNGEHKAYLAIPKTDTYGSAAKPCYVFAEDAATAIGKTNDNETKPASYTLDGRLCPRGAKGIVISNGRKTIRR